jgi:hypothetical protein
MDEPMDEQSAPAHHRRSSVAARFFHRLHRFTNLLRSKWWILALAIAVALGI